jgi:membrane protease YdiL (CAAX protease family)
MNPMQDIPAPWPRVLPLVLLIYLAANAYLLYLGEFNTVTTGFAYAAFLALLSWLTGRIAQPLPAEMAAAGVPEGKIRLWTQTAVLLVIILLTGLGDSRIPLWSEMVARLHKLGESILPAEWFGGPGNSLANPVQFFAIPFLLLMLLGAKPAELGLGRGRKIWRVCLVWLALPVAIWAGLLATGSMSARSLAQGLIGNTFQNGFFEEFLFRGALQTRLRRLLSPPWALTIQALLFGLWHLRANAEFMQGNIPAALAICLSVQMVLGLAYGFVYQRTGNLIAPSIAHVAINAAGQSI